MVLQTFWHFQKVVVSKFIFGGKSLTKRVELELFPFDFSKDLTSLYHQKSTQKGRPMSFNKAKQSKET